ncbi:MAG: hypothetical protein L0211_20470 [Planctomycetaceae bacterium]|nr:hypothetical protein [Planctomycetaceae bacterium]
MPLRIKCPTGHTLIVPDDRAGRTLKCPRCDLAVVVPLGETDTAGRALLSVLAERIPAANLAAGSLRVAQPAASITAQPTNSTATAESRPAGGSLRTIGARTSVAPPTLPRERTPAAQAPVVKPKSRALPTPPPTLPEPVQPQAEPVERQAEQLGPALPKPALPIPEPVVAPAPEPPAPPIEPAPEPPALPAPVVAEQPTPALPEPAAETTPPIALSIAQPEAAPESPPVPIAEEQPAPPIAGDPPAPPPFALQIDQSPAASLNADAARTLAAYQLAAAMAAAAVFSIVPAVWDVVEFLQVAESQFVARWALVLFFMGVVQLAYAVYLFQLPDWTTVWVVTMFSLALAAVYAAVLGLVLLSPADGLLVGPHGLQLADKLAGGKAALWCLCMISLTTILAFFAGRLGTSWHRAEMMLRVAG